ncbi:MAG: hypothetical protein ACE5GN_04600 [Waddliaceae bacterium]
MKKKEMVGQGIKALLQHSGSIQEKEKKAVDNAKAEKYEEPTTRYTYFARRDSLEKIRALAYFDRECVYNVLEEACSAYFSKVGEEKIQEALDAYNASQKSRRAKL